MSLVLLWVVVGASPASADVDPAAVAALERMITSVRELTALSVKALVESDELENGRAVKHLSTIQLTIHRPNRLRAEVQTDRTQRQLFYDGQSFTIWSPRAGYYASAPAPGTIANLVTLAAERYAVDLPFDQVFPWEHFEVGELRAATVLGAALVEGTECDHFAFRQAGIEWELWMDRDSLPRKVQLSDRRVTYSWERGLLGEASQFTFTPPKDARKIELTERLR
jgi:hypothetical protein